MAQDIDFVITELTVDITTASNIGRASSLSLATFLLFLFFATSSSPFSH
jgi:hypothetical protein